MLYDDNDNIADLASIIKADDVDDDSIPRVNEDAWALARLASSRTRLLEEIRLNIPGLSPAARVAVAYAVLADVAAAVRRLRIKS
jgi:hypothetical protein